MTDQLQREKRLYEYLSALDHGDVDTLQAILRDAEHDPELSQMILEVHTALDNEESYHINGSKIMQLAFPNPSNRQSSHKPLTLVATMFFVIFVGALMLAARLAPSGNPVFAPAQSDTTSQMAIFEQFINRVWKDGRTSLLGQLVTTDYKYTEAGNTDTFPTVTSVVVRIEELHRQVERMDITIDETISGENIIWARLTMTATGFRWDDELIEIPDGSIEIPLTMIVRFRENRISETWLDMNITGAMWELSAYFGVDENTRLESQLEETARHMIERIWNSPEVTIDTIREFYDMMFYVRVFEGRTQYTEDAYIRWVTGFRTAFPDLHLEVHNVAADGDTVIVHYTATGTFEYDLCPGGCDTPLKATGEEISWQGVFVYRFEENRVVEEWWFLDLTLVGLFIAQQTAETE